MAVYVKMPKLGLTMETGLITNWLKKEGDLIQKGEVIVEIETDKLATEVESPESGCLLKIFVQENEECKVLEPICIIGQEGEAISDAGSNKSQDSDIKPEDKEETGKNPESFEDNSSKVKASGIAIKMAKKHGIDLSKVQGSGINGRIMQEDVQAVIENGGTPAQEPASGPELLPLTNMRLAIANKMTKSKAEIPHVYFSTKVDASSMNELKNSKKGLVSYNAIIIKAIAKALSEFPVINSSFTPKGIILHKDINIGFAVALEGGLIVPVVKNADAKTTEEIEVEIRSLADKARNNKLAQEEVSNGTFTISNLGVYDIDEFQAIINPPESAIIAIGKIQDTVLVADNKMVIKPQMVINLSVDHRSIDGAVAAQFLQKVKGNLQHA